MYLKRQSFCVVLAVPYMSGLRGEIYITCGSAPVAGLVLVVWLYSCYFDLLLVHIDAIICCSALFTCFWFGSLQCFVVVCLFVCLFVLFSLLRTCFL